MQYEECMPANDHPCNGIKPVTRSPKQDYQQSHITQYNNAIFWGKRKD